MTSPAPPAPPGAPGAVGPEGAEEALGVAAAKGRQPPVSALSAFSHIPARREGPPELSYFHRVGKTPDDLFCGKCCSSGMETKRDNSHVMGFFTEQASATGEEADSTQSSAQLKN